MIQATLDKAAPEPLYTQLREWLRAAIAGGEIKPAAPVPSERELAQRFRISRMTARLAVRELIQTGQLYAVPGKGTFVARPRIEQKLVRLTSFTEDMIARGFVAAARVLAKRVVRPPADAAAALQLQPNARSILLYRLRLANQEPMSLERAHLPHDRLRFVLDHDPSRESLYEILTAHGIRLSHADQWVKAGAASAAEAGVLDIRRGTPVLITIRLSFDLEQRPVEYVRSVYRADRYSFGVTMYR